MSSREPRPSEVRITDTVTLLRADGVHRLRAVNDDRAEVVLVVKDGRLEIWLKMRDA